MEAARSKFEKRLEKRKSGITKVINKAKHKKCIPKKETFAPKDEEESKVKMMTT